MAENFLTWEHTRSLANSKEHKYKEYNLKIHCSLTTKNQ